MAVNPYLVSDRPVAYWPLDETSGTVVRDQSGNGRNGSLSTPGVTLDQPMGSGLRGMSFVGGAGSGTGYVGGIGSSSVFSPAGPSGKMTVEAWAIADVITNSAMMLFTKHSEWNVRGNLGTMTVFTAGAGGGAVLELDGFSSLVAGALTHWAVHASLDWLRWDGASAAMVMG